MGIDGGWYLIGTHVDDVAESFAIKDELCNDIADTPQAEGIQIIRREEGEKSSRFKCSSMSMLMSNVSFGVTSDLFLFCNTTTTCYYN